MNVEDEWLASVVSPRTRDNYRRGFSNFKSWLERDSEGILELRKREGRRFSTRLIQYFNWRKERVSANTARTELVSVQSFLTYWDLGLRMKTLPQITMKLEKYRPSVPDLQAIYKYNDLSTKAWLSLCRDCPARISDLLTFTKEQIVSGEFMIRSKKEGIVGKVYISEQTKELWEKDPLLPKTQEGIAKLLKRSCEIAGVNPLNSHLLRKFWISVATNLGLNEKIVKVLSFKTVDRSDLTYLLNADELRTSWEKVVSAIPLEEKPANGRIPTLMEAVDLMLKVLRKFCIRELQGEGYGAEALGLLKDYSRMTHKEVLEEYLKGEE
jgi:integrase